MSAYSHNQIHHKKIEQSRQASKKTTENPGQCLTKQLQDLKVKLEKQEEELQAYSRETGLAGVCLKLFLLLFKLDFQILKLLGEALTRVFGGFLAGLSALFYFLMVDLVV